MLFKSSFPFGHGPNLLNLPENNPLKTKTKH